MGLGGFGARWRRRGGRCRGDVETRHVQRGLQAQGGLAGRGGFAGGQQGLGGFPAAGPAALQAGGALQVGAQCVGGYRQGAQPALGAGGVLQLHVEAAGAVLRGDAAFGLRLCAGHHQPDLAAGGHVLGLQPQLALQLGLVGAQLQFAQIHYMLLSLLLPLAFGCQALQAQGAGGCGGAAVAAGLGGGGCECHVELQCLAVVLGGGPAVQQVGGQLGVQRGGRQLLHGGLQLPGRGGRAPLALQAHLALAHLHGGGGHHPGGAVELGAGADLAGGQAALVPGAGQAVADIGLQLPVGSRRGTAAAGLRRARGDGATQQGDGCVGPQAGQVECLEVGLGLQQRLGRPGGDVGLHLGLHGRAAGAGRAGVGLHLRLGLQAGFSAGQGALHLGLGGQGQRGLGAAGHRGGDAAPQRGFQGHGGGALQLQLGAVVTVGHVHAVHRQLVVLAVVAVVARQGRYLQRRRAGPAQRVHLEGHIQLQRQGQFLQGRGGAGVGLTDAFDGDGLGVQLAQAQLALQQWAQAPADVQLLHLHHHVGALPAQAADLSAGAQRAADLAGLQRLPCWKETLGLFQHHGQRAAGAGPPP